MQTFATTLTPGSMHEFFFFADVGAKNYQNQAQIEPKGQHLEPQGHRDEKRVGSDAKLRQVQSEMHSNGTKKSPGDAQSVLKRCQNDAKTS